METPKATTGGGFFDSLIQIGQGFGETLLQLELYDKQLDLQERLALAGASGQAPGQTPAPTPTASNGGGILSDDKQMLFVAGAVVVVIILVIISLFAARSK